jgi:hypothetical protein
VQVSAIHIGKGIDPRPILDGKPATFIDASLCEAQEEQKAPERLGANSDMSFVGSYVSGDGFILTPEEKSDILNHSPGEALAIFPFIGGTELNKRCLPKPERHIINFYPKNEHEAAQFSVCFERVERLVKPHRARVKRERRSRIWWLFADQQAGLYHSIRLKGLERVLTVTMTQMQFKFDRVPANYVYDQTVVVILLEKDAHFAVLHSSLHLEWAYKLGASFGSVAAPRYNPSRCFETFPLPPETDSLSIIGRNYYEGRAQMMLERNEGLTKTYSRFHNQGEKSEDIARLRGWQVETDQGVAAAYGWQDLDLDHGFHETKQGLRYSISEVARREVLDRLLVLNHHRHAEEKAERLPQSSLARAKRGKKQDARDQILIEL